RSCGAHIVLPLCCPRAAHTRRCQPLVFFSRIPPPPSSTLFPYTTLFRSPALLHSSLLYPAAVRAGSRCLQGSFRVSHALPVLPRSEEHTSELQSRFDLVCRLLLEKKKTTATRTAMA